MRSRDVIWYWTKQISTHKYFEVQVGRFQEWAWIIINFEWTRKKDHAGIELSLEFIGFHLILKVYDHRHWDYDADDWVKY